MTARERDGFDAGGESACWMHLLCPECGAVLDDDDDTHECDEAPVAGRLDRDR